MTMEEILILRLLGRVMTTINNWHLATTVPSRSLPYSDSVHLKLIGDLTCTFTCRLLTLPLARIAFFIGGTWAPRPSCWHQHELNFVPLAMRRVLPKWTRHSSR